MITRLTGSTIWSEDLNNLLPFYRDTLGLAIAIESPEFVVFGDDASTPSFALGTHSEVKGKNVQPGRNIWNIETADVKRHFEKFVAAGAIVVREPYGFEGYPDSLIATLADPDDNYFQLMTPMSPQPAD